MGKPHKHFDRKDRGEIEKLLDQGASSKTIAAHMNKSARSVCYEVKNHRQEYQGKVSCFLVNQCQRKNVCYNCPRQLRFRICRNCKYRKCSDYCDDVAKKPAL